ncbi:MAG: polyprenyl synthetase family protein [Acidobacteriota bacterium]
MPEFALRPPPLVEFIASRRAEVDAALDAWLPRAPRCPPVLAEGMRYALGSGGKRFRPLLTLASAEAVATALDGDDTRNAAARLLALPAACAVELVHTQSLVHDDLPSMDDDLVRRGQPTVHVRYGEGLAILIGDALLAEAFGLLAREPRSEADAGVTARRLRVIAEVGAAVGAAGMVAGQVIDLTHASGGDGAAGRPSLDLAGLEDMHTRKTGGLIRVAAVSGAIMAGGTPAHVAGVQRFATNIGVAFQIVDDILDVEGGSVEMGKSCGKDAAAAKPTYPALVGLERSRGLAASHVAAAEQALADAGLPDHHLTALARWVLTRRC